MSSEEPQEPIPVPEAPPAMETPLAIESNSVTTAATSKPSHWQIPDGFEDHIEDGLIKAAAGAAVGGLLGLALFKAGNGRRAGSVLAGVGVGLGSAYERAKPTLFSGN